MPILGRVNALRAHPLRLRDGGAGRRRATLVAAVLITAAAAGPALAHSDVASTSPARGATLERTPARMAVTFSDPVGRIGKMRVTRGGRGNLVKGAAISRRNARTVMIRLKRPGPRNQPGTYRLRWRVIGADGHALTGTVTFRVRR